MKIRLDADLFSVLKVCARVYDARQLMRFGMTNWTRYCEEPMKRWPWMCFCDATLPTHPPHPPHGDNHFDLVHPVPSAMQGHWE